MDVFVRVYWLAIPLPQGPIRSEEELVSVREGSAGTETECVET